MIQPDQSRLERDWELVLQNGEVKLLRIREDGKCQAEVS